MPAKQAMRQRQRDGRLQERAGRRRDPHSADQFGRECTAGGLARDKVYTSLRVICPNMPSREFIDCLGRSPWSRPRAAWSGCLRGERRRPRGAAASRDRGHGQPHNPPSPRPLEATTAHCRRGGWRHRSVVTGPAPVTGVPQPQPSSHATAAAASADAANFLCRCGRCVRSRCQRRRPSPTPNTPAASSVHNLVTAPRDPQALHKDGGWPRSLFRPSLRPAPVSPVFFCFLFFVFFRPPPHSPDLAGARRPSETVRDRHSPPQQG